MGKSKKYGMNTKALHANKRFEPISGDVMPPLHLSTTYINDVPGESEYFYGRVNNPTRELFERTLASLEGIENYEEQHAFAMASGMSAVSLIAELAKPGDNVVITKDVYGGTTNYFSKIIRERGVEVNFCDFADTEKLDSLLNEKTKLAWIESPSNPSMNLYDLQKISEIVHGYPTLLVADSTFSTPFITRPFEHGVDIIMHSTTKYIGGHSDTLGGAVVCKDPELHETLMLYQRQGGAIMSPFDSYLVQRGLYSLGPRIKLHSENAHKLAEYLENSEHIREVRYPGLKGFENHEIAVKQMQKDMEGFNHGAAINLTTSNFENGEAVSYNGVSFDGFASLEQLLTFRAYEENPEINKAWQKTLEKFEKEVEKKGVVDFHKARKTTVWRLVDEAWN